MAEDALVGVLVDLIGVFVIAGAVGIFVAKVGRVPYTIALLLAGFAASVVGVEVDIALSHDLILLVLLPPLLFEGAATTDLERFRRNLVPILLLAVPGLLVSITLLGIAGTRLFGFAPVVALLFAAMILPTDPVSVLALFEELGAPERLATLVEGESLINDGVGVVVFSTLLVLVYESGADGTTTFSAALVGEVGLGIVVASLGGAAVGLVAGYVVYRVMVNLDEHMTEIVLTAILAYGSFLVAEHYLGVSGVIATVVSGLFIGNRGAEYAMSPQTKLSIFNAWDTAAFVVNTFIFVAIGATTPVEQLVAHGRLIAIAILLVVGVRALAVYPIVGLVNRLRPVDVPLDYQHVMVWGGLHASIPIALVLGLETLPSGDPFPHREALRAMVFGVAGFSLVVQGLTMGTLLDRLDVVTRSAEAELYELLVGRARAVDSALESAEALRAAGQLSEATYEEFTAEYERETADLQAAIHELLEEYPDLRREEVLAGERQVLRREKAAISDAARSGLVTDDVAEDLIQEVDVKLDRVRAGESTVGGGEEEYEEFWRARAAEFGIEAAEMDE